LKDAVRNGDVEKVRILLAAGTDKDGGKEKRRGTSPLGIAAANGFTEVVKVLLEFGAGHMTTRPDGSTPLHMAVQVHSPPLSSRVSLNELTPTIIRVQSHPRMVTSAL
jgi:ankyrin repeat protein